MMMNERDVTVAYAELKAEFECLLEEVEALRDENERLRAGLKLAQRFMIGDIT